MRIPSLGLLLFLAACSAAPTIDEIQQIIPSPSPQSQPTATDIITAPTPSESILEPSTTPVTSVRFAVIGDYGEAGEKLASVAELIKSWDPDLIITVGDNNYPDGEFSTIDENIGQYFHEYIYPYQGTYGEGARENRFFPTLGNHDWYETDAAAYLDYFELPGNERYYDFVWGPVHFFAIDSDSREPDRIGRSSEQATWLREKLAASTSQWKIVYMHHPPYSSALHGSQGALQWPFQEWGAHAVIAGHDHVYERIVINGFPYFVNGLGGSSTRYGFFIPVVGSQVRYRSLHGAMLVEATLNQITFEFVNIQGEVIDTFVLTTD